jgi:RNA polymerase sigma-70 factor (ECF subfamily)
MSIAAFVRPLFGRSSTTAQQEQARQENLAVAAGLKRQQAGLLDELIVRYQHRLLRYLLYLTGNRDLAEDLFQEVWMRVLVRGAQFNGKARFDTWLFTIARNLVIDHRRKRTMASLDELFEGGGEDDRPMSFAIASGEPTPFDRFVNLEGRERVAAALLDLDTLHREVLVLRFHEELSLNEIATVTRTPLSTVKSRLYRGLAAIRPKLAAYGEANCAFGEAAAEGVEERLEVEIQARTADLSARPATVDALPERA